MHKINQSIKKVAHGDALLIPDAETSAIFTHVRDGTGHGRTEGAKVSLLIRATFPTHACQHAKRIPSPAQAAVSAAALCFPPGFY